MSIYIDIYGKNAVVSKSRLIDLSERLASMIDRSKPWGYKYMLNMITGNQPISAQVMEAIQILGQLHDEVMIVRAKAKRVTVLGHNGHIKEMSLIIGHSRRCKRCKSWFVPDHWNRRYCCHQCRHSI